MGSGGAVRSVATKLCRLSSNQQQPRCCALSPSPAPLPAVANSSDSIPHFSVSAASAAQDPKFFPSRSRCTTSSSIASSSTQFALTRCFSSQLAPNEAKNVVFVDTLALVRKLESHGFSANQAEAITAVITDVLNDCLDSVGHSFVSKSDLQKSDMLQEAALLKLKTEMESSELLLNLEKKVSAIQREAEKIKVDIDKLKAEMRYEMDKISAGQRLDLNLERGRMREELAKQSADTSNLTNKLNKEIHALKTQLEASKYEVIKYCIGTIVSVMALGLGLLRIFK